MDYYSHGRCLHCGSFIEEIRIGDEKGIRCPNSECPNHLCVVLIRSLKGGIVDGTKDARSAEGIDSRG